MTHTPRVLTEPHLVRAIAKAYRGKGRPVVVVPVWSQWHAGHAAVLDAARRVTGGVVVVAHDGEVSPDLSADFVVPLAAAPQQRLVPSPELLAQRLATRGEDALLARLFATAAQVGATDMFLGDKDYPLLVALQGCLRGFGLETRVHTVPTVRMPDGVAVSNRNAELSPAGRDAAVVVAAIMTAAHSVAERGPAAVKDTVHGLLADNGLKALYVDVTAPDYSPIPGHGPEGREGTDGEAPQEGRLSVGLIDPASGTLISDTVALQFVAASSPAGEVAPGITVEDVKAHTGCDIKVAPGVA